VQTIRSGLDGSGNWDSRYTMQTAALLLEKATEQVNENEAKAIVRPRRRASR
jgi:hypothetical protein